MSSLYLSLIRFSIVSLRLPESGSWQRASFEFLAGKSCPKDHALGCFGVRIPCPITIQLLDDKAVGLQPRPNLDYADRMLLLDVLFLDHTCIRPRCLCTAAKFDQPAWRIIPDRFGGALDTRVVGAGSGWEPLTHAWFSPGLGQFALRSVVGVITQNVGLLR